LAAVSLPLGLLAVRSFAAVPGEVAASLPAHCDASAILAAVRTATGGGRWDRAGALQATGSASTAGRFRPLNELPAPTGAWAGRRGEKFVHSHPLTVHDCVETRLKAHFQRLARKP
jgi:hypothetical protein